MRLVSPRAEIRAAGGREGHLRSLGALALWPANSLFVDGYLTTRGDATRETYRMIRDAGFEVDGNPVYDRETARSDAAGGFRLEGGPDTLLRPEIARSTRGVG
jgi:biotin synthase